MVEIRYTPPRCKFVVDNGHIVTDKSVKNKVTGTSVAGILRCSPWSTPFQVACALLGLGREDISKKPEVMVGQVLESKIVKYAGETYGQYGLFMGADEVYDKREGDHDAWESDFSDTYFAGHVDGIVMSPDGVNYILEVKTSKNLDSWAEGVPEYYYWQVALYNEFIAKQDKAYVVLGITSDATMRDVNSWVPNQNTVGMFEMDIDRADVQEKMEQIRQWYDEYIVNGITPDHDPTNPKDVALYDHLVNISRDKTDISGLIDQFVNADTRIVEYEEKEQTLYEFRENLKAMIRDYQVTHRLSTIDSTSGEYYAQMTVRPNTKWDEAAMIRDGIDPDRYKIKTSTEFVTIKQRTEKQLMEFEKKKEKEKKGE